MQSTPLLRAIFNVGLVSRAIRVSFSLGTRKPLITILASGIPCPHKDFIAATSRMSLPLKSSAVYTKSTSYDGVKSKSASCLFDQSINFFKFSSVKLTPNALGCPAASSVNSESRQNWRKSLNFDLSYPLAEPDQWIPASSTILFSNITGRWYFAIKRLAINPVRPLSIGKSPAWIISNLLSSSPQSWINSSNCSIAASCNRVCLLFTLVQVRTDCSTSCSVWPLQPRFVEGTRL